MNAPVLFRQYRTLDAIVVVYALTIVGLIVWALIFRTIQDNQLAILAGLAGTVLGVVSGYCAARWGVPSSQRAPEPGGTSTTVTTTAPADAPTIAITPASAA